jgi:hypothetical protein
MPRRPSLSVLAGGIAVTLAAAGAVPALGQSALGQPAHGKPPKHGHPNPKPHPPHPPQPPKAAPATFSVGQLQAQNGGQTGCGTNSAGEPSIHVSKANLVALASEDGLASGSEFWSGHQVRGTSPTAACALTYGGQPNAFGAGASGGDVDIAIAPGKDASTGTYRIYVASLNVASVNVATSTDDGKTFGQVPVVAGVPGDDREWIAAYGASTALLTYHDVATGNIDVLRSDDGGQTFVQTSRVIDDGDYKSGANQHGNLVIDHVNKTGAATDQFWAYQSFVAPSTSSGSKFDEAFLGVSNDGGATWTTKPIPCTTKFGSNGLDHNFPAVSVAPNGTLFYAVSNDKAVYVATSTNHGNTWTCSGPVSTGTQAIFPWIVATNTGVDLVYYGAKGTGSGQLWSAYFAETLTQSPTTWTTTKVADVHRGSVCEGGISCSDGRQLFDDFGVDTDQSGWAHIAYSHDSPNLGDANTYTGYAVQTGGTPIGAPN